MSAHGWSLTVVGCAGSYPGPDSPASSYLLQADDADGRTWRMLMDFGNGALGALHHYADPLSIDAVLLSHLHVDHCIDMTSYYVLRKYHPAGAQPRIPVWGPSDTAGRLARAYDLPDNPGMTGEFDFQTYDGRFEIGPFTVTPVPVDHPVEAYGLRVEAGGTALAYTGDTGPTDALIELADGVDVLLAEASFREGEDNPPHLHLTGAEAGRLATDADAARLVITHVPAWYDAEAIRGEAASCFEGSAELARPGAVYRL